MLRSSLVRALAAALAASGLGALGASCRDTGRPYACECTFLTDFDDASSQPARVCAPTPERAPAIARGCAQAGAPGPVQACTCRPLDGDVCSSGACLPTPIR